MRAWGPSYKGLLRPKNFLERLNAVAMSVLQYDCSILLQTAPTNIPSTVVSPAQASGLQV